jgi:general secretion pathway protein D
MTTTPRRHAARPRAAAAILWLTLGRAAAQAPAPPPAVPAPAAPRPARPAAPIGLPAAARPAAARPAIDPTSTALKFEGAPSDIVLQTYAEVTGRTLLIAPDVPKATITLRSQSELTREEFLQAIETVLLMNGIALTPAGDKFLKVLPAKDIRKLGVRTEFDEPTDGLHPEVGRMVSQMVPLQHITLEEARKTIEGFKRGDGQIQLFERTNSILITDTTENVNRMMEILRFVDQPLVCREETNIRAIRFAKAADIKKRLEEIVAESLKAQQQAQSAPVANVAGPPGITRRTLPAPAPVPGVIRPATPAPPEPAEEKILETLVADAERGVIRGKVQIVADERTNLLIVITRPENMAFFDKIINVLDVETAPDIMVEIFRLEYAQAKDVATMLNDLIGNVRQDDGQAPPSSTAEAAPRSETLAEAAARRLQAAQPAEAGMSKVGELNKENIKILADERTNALIIMASKSDLATLRAIVKDMDIMLSQVLIETVIVEVNLSDNLTTGIDWVQRSLIGIGSDREPVVGFAGHGGGGLRLPRDALGFNTPESFGSAVAGITYYTTFFDLNVDAVIEASATDSRTRTLASPVILTQDNKEAVVEATTDQYFFKGKKYAGEAAGNPIYEDDVEMKSVGLTVKVTPQINVKGFVVMKIEESIENIAGTQRINEGDWPIVASRKLSADIAVQSGQTIMLGGLVQDGKTVSHGKIPLLGDIPFLGRLFRSDKSSDTRSEVLVFLTPYVLDTPEDLKADAMRRKAASDMGDIWRQGWSASDLADPPDMKTSRRLESVSNHMETVFAAPVDRLGRPLRGRAAPRPAPRLATPVQPIADDRTTVTTNLPDTGPGLP